MRAMVIDDSKAMRRLIASILGELGFEVGEAANGREGLERLGHRAPPDLVLVDWNMPEMNGLEFVQAVRADEAYRDVCLVMVTTETEMSRVAQALDAGADEYIMKPFTTAVIREKLVMLEIVTD